MLDADGRTTGEIIRLQSKRCPMEGCLSYCASVRWPGGRVTYPCMSMVKQISETQYQLCHTAVALSEKGLTVKAVDASG